MDSDSHRKKSISILLGAGFSVPAGYPTGGMVNDKICNFDFSKWHLSHNDSLVRNDFNEPYNYNQRFLEFLKRVLNRYISECSNVFLFEEFFDFLYNHEAMKGYEEEADGLIREDEQYYDMVFHVKKIYKQIVRTIIKERTTSDIFIDRKYEILLRSLHNWANDSIVNVHTLNYDSLFESFQGTEYLCGKVSDGFELDCSEYYANIISPNGENRNVRLAKYTGNYSTPIRLFKLHGGFNYRIFRKHDGIIYEPSVCLKLKDGIGINYLRRKFRNNKGNSYYEDDHFSEEPFCLIGKRSKIQQYNDCVLIRKLMDNFRDNLQLANNLLLIGYGGGDVGINNMILQNYNYLDNPVKIICLNPSQYIYDLALKMNTDIINKSIIDIKEEDLNF